MATKGLRPTGTDGTDFRHRQRVAPHYQQSVTLKFRLKIAIGLHVLLYVLMVLKLLEDLLDRFDIDWAPLERLKVPEPHAWEILWTASFFPLIGCLVALPKNREAVLRYSYYGLFSFGLLPIMFGAGSFLPSLWRFARDPAAPPEDGMFLGKPVVALWYIFFTVAAQVHVFELYCTGQLIKSWRPRATTPISANANGKSPMNSVPQGGDENKKHK